MKSPQQNTKSSKMHVADQTELSNMHVSKADLTVSKYFDPVQINKLIKTYQDFLIESSLALQDKETPFRELEKRYFDDKKIYEDIVAENETNMKMIDSLVKYKENIKPGKQIKILQQTTHASKGPRGSNKNKSYPWLELGIDALKKANHFSGGHDLWDIVMQENPEIQKTLSQDKRYYGKVRHSTVYNWRLGATKDYKYKTLRPIVIHKDKFGLAEWMDEEGQQPQPKYLKEFMYGTSN